MAYQSKKYRKFVATAATATLVATAVAPAAGFAAEKDFTDTIPNWAEKAVDYLVGKGAIEGYPDGTFKQGASIKRGEAAKILALTLDLKVDESAKTNFADAKDHWASSYIAAIQAQLPGVIDGDTKGNFRPNDTITRQEMAKMVVEAYDLELNPAAVLDFTDNTSWGKEYVNVLASLGVVEGVAEGKFAPGANVTRGQAAVFVHRTEVPSERVAVETTEPTVVSVSAINATSLSVSGQALAGLKAEDIKVANNTVASVSASEDGKTAVITLGSKLVVDTATKVTIGEKEFEVTYSIQANSIAVVNQTYDDDTKDQYVAITLDGVKVTAQELIDAGYTVEFTGFAKKSGTKLNTLFTSGAAASTTGELATDLNDTSGGFVTELLAAGVLPTGSTNLPTAGVEIYVQVKISKGTETIQSEVSPIKIQNIDLATESISKYTLENFGANKGDEASAVAADGTSVIDGGSDDFIQTSTTLVTGEIAALRNITIVNDGKEEVVPYSDKLVAVSSSNPAVVSVDTATGELTAQTPGTATITIAYGTQTKTVALTVTNTKRALNKAVITENNAPISAKTMIKDANGTFTGVVYDQYGDPISTPVTAKVTNASTTTPIAWLRGGAADQTVTSGANGKFTINVEPKNAGSVVVTFHDAAGNKLTNSQLRVNVTANADLASYKLVTLDSSADLILDSLDTNDNKGEVVVKGFTSENVDLGVQTLTDGTGGATDVKIIKSTVTNTETTGYTVKWAESVVGLVDPSSVKVATATNSIEFVTNAGKAGTVTLTFINNTNNKQATITYTVKAVGENIKSAALKKIPVPTFGKTIDYRDVLTFRASENDPIITGITLTSNTAQPIRLDINNTVGSTTGSSFYIDKNANGVYDSGDVVVGELQLTLVGSFANGSSTIPAGWDSAIPTTEQVGDTYTQGANVYTYVADGDGSGNPGWNLGSTQTIVSLPSPADGDTYVRSTTTYTYNAAVTTVADEINGIAVRTGDNGTIIFKVLDKDGNVQASSDVRVNF